ncbi:MAG: hypothetical protein WC712_14145, partial [Candidatus Brocadiia bacterium]
MRPQHKILLRAAISGLALLVTLAIAAMFLFGSRHDVVQVSLERTSEGKAVLHLSGNFAQAASISLTVFPPSGATFSRLLAGSNPDSVLRAVRLNSKTIILTVTSGSLLPDDLGGLEFAVGGKVQAGDFEV